MKRAQPVLLMARELGLGGSERQLCEIAKSLDRSRFEPHAGCFHSSGFRADELRAAGVPILRLPVTSFRGPSALRGAYELGRYVRAHGIEIVHTFDVPMNEFAVPVARMFSVPFVLSSQRAHRDLVSRANRHLLRLTDFMVDGIVVNSFAVRRQLIEEDRVPPSRIHVCYNAIDMERFHPGPRARHGALDGACLVIGVICALRPEKDLPTLMDAFARVRGLRPGLKLVIVGSGPVLPELEELRRRLNLAECCHLEPATADVAGWLHKIDIFVLPSRSEALSNSLMEAMACQCAVVASRVGGNPELVDDDGTGLLFPPGDAGALAACLKRLIEHDATRARLAEAGAIFMRNFSLEAATRRIEEIYGAVTGSLSVK
jgi:glycosyltransferase involved in cell wall biosynthesis